jgi:hypothetical protein
MNQVRRDSIKDTAASYLAENITKTPNIKVLPHTEVTGAEGEGAMAIRFVRKYLN